jgi:RimJ/RimL family protein N-acetyltransferase
MTTIRLAGSPDEAFLKSCIEAAYHEYPRLISRGNRTLERAADAVVEQVSNDGFAHIASVDGQPVGASWWTPESDEEMSVAYFVTPDSRGNGVATKLLEAGLVEAKARGMRSTLVKTHPENQASIALARKVGFEPVVALLRQAL